MIARAIERQPTDESILVEEYREKLVEDLCDAFAEDNPRFNRARFRQACGLEI